MNHEQDITMLLARYFAGHTTDEEKNYVKNWVNAHPENEQHFAVLYEVWHNSLLVKPHTVIDAGNAYQSFLNKIDQPSTLIKSRKKWILMAVTAAVVTIVFLVSLLDKGSENKPILNQLAAVRGKVSRVTLADGTIVWLNSGSVLKYGADFGKSTRSVYLEGEAFFEIAPGKKDIPFLVHTKNYIVRDIGTRFNLKAYPNDQFFETAVLNGEVSIEDKGYKDNATNRIYIKQKQMLRIWNNDNTNTTIGNNKQVTGYNDIQITEFTADKQDNYIGWKDNMLVFDSNTMEEIARVLERKYNVTINIADTTLQHIRYSGNFQNVTSIDKILDIIKQNTPINYSASAGGRITITKQKN